jgi:hypothetical protein
MIETGEFPHLAEFGNRDILSSRDADQTFRVGLEWLLAGVADSLG